MAEPYLTTREFDNWSETHDKKMDHLTGTVEKLAERQADFREEVLQRVATIEANNKKASKSHATLSSVVSAGVSGAVTALFHLFGSRS